MNQQCVVAVFDDRAEAERALRLLEARGYSHDEVSLVAEAVSDELTYGEEAEIGAGDEGLPNAVKGAAMGGLLGALVSSPLLIVSGIGAAVVAGPITVAAAGAIVGGFLGGMSGWGVHTDHVQEYENKVRDGKILVVVSGDERHTAEAERILRTTLAREVNLHARTDEDSPEIDDRPGHRHMR